MLCTSVRSRWLDVGQARYVFIDRDEVEEDKKSNIFPLGALTPKRPRQG